jgi:polyphosphate kinase
MPSRKQYINRDLSWLEFDARVLEEAADRSTPLLERLKFIAIVSSNLDEFFMVRAAGVRQQVVNRSVSTDPSGLTPAQQQIGIRRRVLTLVARQYRLLAEILSALEHHNVHLRRPDQLTRRQQDDLRKYFTSNILPVLTPIAIDPSHPFPILNNCVIEVAIRLLRPDSRKPGYAFVEIPASLPRFVPVALGSESVFVLLEDVVMAHLDALFSGCEILESFPFRLTRDMDFTLDEEGVRDLLVHIEKKLIHRRRRSPIRLELPRGCRGTLATWLRAHCGLAAEDTYMVAGPHHLKNFFELIGKVRQPELFEPEWPPLPVPQVSDHEPVFAAIRRHGCIANYLPFQTFDPLVRLIEEAAADPNVLAIKQTLYRVSGNSPVVNALVEAAQNGKQVTVIVELKARFDEESNINWARRLERSGAHVIYGIAGLKIHGKALLVIRREEGMIRRYLHLSTGNYNDRTARQYTDIGVFFSDPELCSDVANLFNVMTGYSAHTDQWSRLAVAPFDFRERSLALIDREARLAASGRPARILAKMNSLVDAEIVEHLFRAARAGVEIDLIVRGICCLRPTPELPNLRVVSIVDRYLEHTRIYVFGNDGDPEYYLSSADWMPRNLDRRIEIFFPIADPGVRETFDQLLKLQLADRRKSHRLLPSGAYSRSGGERHRATRSQAKTYDLFRRAVPTPIPLAKGLHIFE